MRIYAVALGLLLSVGLASPVIASEAPPLLLTKEAKKSFKNLESRLASKKESEQALKSKAGKIKSELSGLQKNMVGIAQTVQKHEAKLNSLDRQLMELKAKKALYKKSIESDNKSIPELVLALERLSRVPPETVLLQPGSPVDTARSSRILQKTLPDIQKRAIEYDRKLIEINAIEKEIKEKIELQAEEYQDLSEKKNNLQAMIRKRQAVYEITLDEQKKQSEDVAQLSRQAHNLKDLFARLQENENLSSPKAKDIVLAKPTFSKTRMPVAGDIVTRFGEKDALGASSEGLTFNARPGATVTAPMSGKVRFAGPFQNYKQILIIEHSGGYHSMIAGLGRIDTVVGASLAEGEPVGSLDTSPQGTAKLYYELRRNGKTIDPNPVLLAQGK